MEASQGDDMCQSLRLTKLCQMAKSIVDKARPEGGKHSEIASLLRVSPGPCWKSNLVHVLHAIALESCVVPCREYIFANYATHGESISRIYKEL